MIVGCQKAPVSPTPGATTTTTAASPAESAAAGFQMKLAEGKDASFEPKSSWFDPRSDLKKGTITLGNYDFLITAKSSNSLENVEAGQSRASITLKSPDGAEFGTPIPKGDYTGDAISFVAAYTFEDGAHKQYSFENPKGTVKITDLSDKEMSGTVDLTDDKGATLKGDFKATITAEPTTAGGKLPFEFPASEVDAKAGQMVFTPMPSLVADMMAMGKKRPGDYRPRKLVKAGPETSTIEDNGKEVEIPNSLIVSIPADGKAKVGDIVLCTPKYGAMMRAMVTDAKDPTKPTVHFYKPIYGDKDPASADFSGQLEAGSFRPVPEGVNVGAIVSYDDGGKLKTGSVLKVAGGKVLVETFGGDVSVFEESALTVVPLKPSLKEGDKVTAPFGGATDIASVTKIDQKLGRVWVKFDNNPSTGIFAFGEVIPAK